MNDSKPRASWSKELWDYIRLPAYKPPGPYQLSFDFPRPKPVIDAPFTPE